MNQKRPEGWDWRAELGKHEARAAHEAFDDQVSLFRLVGKLLALPVRIPLYLRKVSLRRREMLRFAQEQSMDRIMSDELTREVSLQWVESHPEQYPLGEYDPRLPRLQRTFQTMMGRRK